MLDTEEFNRWIKSATRTLESARRDYVNGDYNWACFKAQQAAEKSIKAMLWGLGNPRIGHSLIELGNTLSSIGIEVDKEVMEYLARLSKFYIPTRYPDAWSEGIPEDYYTRTEAEEAIKMCEFIVNWVISKWRELLRKGGEEGNKR